MAKLWQTVFLLIIMLLVLPECWAGKRTRDSQKDQALPADSSHHRRPITRSTKLPHGYLDDILHAPLKLAERRKYQQASRYLLEQLDLEVFPTAPDGDCLFDALDQQLLHPMGDHKLREWLLGQALEINERSHSGRYKNDKERAFWEFFHSLFGGDIENLVAGLSQTRIWADALTVVPLAAFALKQPVIHIKPSNQSPWYEIQAVDEDGNILDQDKWKQLLSKSPLFVVNNGSGHYEGATGNGGAVAIGDVELELFPEEDIFRTELTAEMYEEGGSNPVRESGSPPPLQPVNEGAGPVKRHKLDPALRYEEISPARVSDFDEDPAPPVMQMSLQPIDVDNWLQQGSFSPKKHAGLRDMVRDYGLKVWRGGFPQIAKGFFGALMASFSRRGVFYNAELHDMVFLKEIRFVLERAQYQPFLGSMIDKALAFCIPSAQRVGKRQHVLVRALEELNEQVLKDLKTMPEEIWETSCLPVALSSLYNTPLVLMHPYAVDGVSLLYEPWKPVVGVPAEQLDTVIKTLQPAILIHNGGEGPLARWKAVTFSFSGTPPFESSEYPLVQNLSFVLVPILRGFLSAAKENFARLDKESLPDEYYKYLRMRVAFSQGLSSDGIYDIYEGVRQISDSQTDEEWKVGWRLFEAFLLKELGQYQKADEVLIRQARKKTTPEYLQPGILEMRTYIALFDQKDLQSAQDILLKNMQITERFRKLGEALSIIYGRLNSAGRALPLLSKLVDENPYDLDVILALASIYSTLGMPDKAIGLLTQIPEYREVAKVTRALAAAYADNHQTNEALNLMSLVCEGPASKENMGVILSIFAQVRDPEILNSCLPVIDTAASRGLVSLQHSAVTRLSVRVSLGEYSEASRLYQKETTQADTVLDNLIRETRYRRKRKEFKHVIGLSREVLKLSPNNREYIAIQALALERDGQIEEAGKLYAEHYDTVFEDPQLAANATVFFEKNPKLATAFFGSRIPECPSCYLWFKLISNNKRGERHEGLTKSFKQHMRNMSSKGGFHRVVHSHEELRWFSIDAYHHHIEQLENPTEPQSWFQTRPEHTRRYPGWRGDYRKGAGRSADEFYFYPVSTSRYGKR